MLNLVWAIHVFVEYSPCHLDEAWVRNPSSIVAGTHFAEFVLSNSLHGLLIGLRVVADRYLSRHASHRVNAALVARVNQQLDIGTKEWLFHRDTAPLRQSVL